jgi:hypothetical protein
MRCLASAQASERVCFEMQIGKAHLGCRSDEPIKTLQPDA